MRMCRQFYKKGKIYDNGTYDIDAQISTREYYYRTFSILQIVSPVVL